MLPELRLRREGGRELPVLVWRFPEPLTAVTCAPHGGGLGPRRWVVNAQVPPSYGRRDPEHHLGKLSVSLGLPGRGVGMLTAVDVRGYVETFDGGVTSVATVGLGTPVCAAAPDEPRARAALVGTVNVVVFVPARLSDAAMVNAVATIAEAKAQALRDLGLDATGTATDAVCVTCPSTGRPEPFGGPRSTWGARLARTVHAGVLAGAR